MVWAPGWAMCETKSGCGLPSYEGSRFPFYVYVVWGEFHVITVGIPSVHLIMREFFGVFIKKHVFLYLDKWSLTGWLLLSIVPIGMKLKPKVWLYLANASSMSRTQQELLCTWMAIPGENIPFHTFTFISSCHLCHLTKIWGFYLLNSKPDD